jgi:TRAP-type transport system periplasmic protein
MKNLILKPAVLVLVGALLVISLLAGACATSTVTPTTSVPTKAEPIKLRAAGTAAATHPLEQLLQRWIEKIQNETNGRVIITHYYGGVLVDQGAAWDQLRSGVADIAQVGISVPGVPFNISNAFLNAYYGIDLLGARQVWNKVFEEFPELRAEYTGARILSFTGGTVSLYLHSRKPVRTLNDLKGLQIPPPLGLESIVGKLGFTGSQVPMLELLTYIEKGIIDGNFMPVDALQTMNIADVTQYSTNFRMVGPPAGFYGMNQDSWNRLPPDIQKVFEDSIPWWEGEIDKVSLEMNQKSLDWAKAQGHVFFDLPPEDQDKFNNLVGEIVLKNTEELDAKGLPGTKVYQEIRRLIDEYNNK